MFETSAANLALLQLCASIFRSRLRVQGKVSSAVFDEWTFVSGLCAQPFSLIDDLRGSFVALTDPPTRSDYNLESSANFGQNLVKFFFVDHRVYFFEIFSQHLLFLRSWTGYLP